MEKQSQLETLENRGSNYASTHPCQLGLWCSGFLRFISPGLVFSVLYIVNITVVVDNFCEFVFAEVIDYLLSIALSSQSVYMFCCLV
jgi:hypothetical protein